MYIASSVMATTYSIAVPACAIHTTAMLYTLQAAAITNVYIVYSPIKTVITI